jgi:hypothetical protein
MKNKIFFFSMMKRSKNHTRSMLYEKRSQNIIENIIPLTLTLSHIGERELIEKVLNTL